MGEVRVFDPIACHPSCWLLHSGISQICSLADRITLKDAQGRGEAGPKKQIALVTAMDKGLEQGVILEEHPCPVDACSEGTDAAKCVCRIICSHFGENIRNQCFSQASDNPTYSSKNL